MNEEYILLSWISNYGYCPRRFYLSAVEGQAPGSNIFMTEGTISHQRVDTPKIERRGSKITVTRLYVNSEKYLIEGICDNVEFNIDDNGANIPFLGENCFLIPVEYKHGKMRNEKEYDMQLMGQALCLEEMFGTHIEKGYIYYTDAHHRHEVVFSEELRSNTIESVNEMRKIINDQVLLEPKYMKRCPKCAYYEICSPRKKMVSKYMKELWSKI